MSAGETILVVEDEALVRMVAVETLEDFGFAVLEAANADEALATLDRTPAVRVLVTDVGLPGMNGRQLADEARRRRPDLRVVFMTGYAPQAAAGGDPPGVVTLGKPFTPDQLHDAVRGMLSA
ncbi:MAG: response regulator [Hyphomonadaceae bacterium]|nr:response regulator [Hyphomonadaceae bacterium]